MLQAVYITGYCLKRRTLFTGDDLGRRQGVYQEVYVQEKLKNVIKIRSEIWFGVF